MALRAVEFHILLALAVEECHGYAILQEVSRITDGELDLEPGTLYRALHRMLKDGWVAECGRRSVPTASARAARPEPPGSNEERRRYYKLTALGRRVATAEADRLSKLVSIARRHQLVSHA